MEQVLLISLLSGLATGIGGLIVIWFGNPSPKLLGFYLGISAGMMGMVVLVDLLPASLEYGSFFHTIIGLIIGILLMLSLDSLLHSSYPESLGKERPLVHDKGFYRRMGYFMTFAIALHNVPEGLAIGAGFENQEELGIRLALIIALHNVPEGLGVASTLFLGGLSSLAIFSLPLVTGLFIPVGTIISELIGRVMPDWISLGLSIAAGAMGYLVVRDVAPESIRLHYFIGRLGIAVGIFILYIVYIMH